MLQSILHQRDVYSLQYALTRHTQALKIYPVSWWNMEKGKVYEFS
jgi:hypothetical protein